MMLTPFSFKISIILLQLVHFFAAYIKTIKMTYLRSQDGNSGYFKERDTDNDGALTNRPISMWYWLAFGLIGYYIYKKVKK